MSLSSTLYPLALVTLGASTGLGSSIFDNFDDGNDTNPAWLFIDATNQGSGGLGTRDFGPDNNRYRLSGPATASVRTGYNFLNGEVRCEVSNWNPNVAAGTSVGILASFDPVTFSGYFLSIDADGSPNLNLVRLENSAVDGGETGPTKNYDAGKTYILQLIVARPKLTCRVYEKVTPENILIDEFEWSDPTPHPTGLTGLLVVNDAFPGNLESATAMFDNFFATDGDVRQPTLTNPTIVGENFQLTFATEPGRTYALEYKDVITTPLWNELTTIAPKPAAGNETASDPLTAGNRFYQVRVVDDSP